MRRASQARMMHHRVSTLLRTLAASALMLGAVLAPATAAHAAPFTSGNVVVYRVGTGTGSLVNTGNPVFLDEYTPAGALVQSVALPTSASGANHRLIASGTATSEGLLTRSDDTRYLVATGYDAAVGGASSLSGTASATVPRTVALVDCSAVVNSSTALTDFADGNNPRSAVSDDGSRVWVAGGAGGVREAPVGASTSTQLSTTVTNLRQLGIFGSQLSTSTNSGSAVRIGKVGSGLPTTSGQTIANLPGFPTSGSPFSYALFDLDAGVAGLDTLYVAEDTTGGGQIQKYSLVSGSWTAKGTIAAPTVRGLVGTVSGSSVTLFVTTDGGGSATGGGKLQTLTDSSGANATISGSLTLLATAGANQAFRGVAFAPTCAPPAVTPEVPSVLLLPLAAAGVGAVFVGFGMRRRRRAA